MTLRRGPHAATFEMVVANILRRSVPSETGCLVWPGQKNCKGYGFVRCRRKMMTAHRIIWEANNGPIPPDLLVLHTCDTPACVSVEHLYLGDNDRNMRDKCERDRSGKALDIAKAIEIKLLLAQGLRQKEIAGLFGVNPATISKIATGLNWSHVDERLTGG